MSRHKQDPNSVLQPLTNKGYQLTSLVTTWKPCYTMQAAQDTLEVGSEFFAMEFENSVGTLQEICSYRQLPFPEYELTKEEGPAHDRLFSYTCMVGQLWDIGCGRNKKMAKQRAAHNLMRRYKGQMQKTQKHKYRRLIKNKALKIGGIVGRFHILKDPLLGDDNAALMILNTEPETICFGEGRTPEDAKIRALKAAVGLTKLLSEQTSDPEISWNRPTSSTSSNTHSSLDSTSSDDSD